MIDYRVILKIFSAINHLKRWRDPWFDLKLRNEGVRLLAFGELEWRCWMIVSRAGVIDICNQFYVSLMRHFIPEELLTVDKQLESYRRSTPAPTYLSSNPASMILKFLRHRAQWHEINLAKSAVARVWPWLKTKTNMHRFHTYIKYNSEAFCLFDIARI